MENVHADETREARFLLATAFEAVPGNGATTGDELLRTVSRRRAHRRRTRALVSATGVVAAAGATAAVLLSATVTAAPPALAAVTSALARAAAGSFRMSLIVTQRNTVPGQPSSIQSPLSISGELDLKRNLGEETLSNGWRTRIVGQMAYTELPPAQQVLYGTDGKPWTQTPLAATAPPYASSAAQLAWDLNSDRPFNPEALLALLKSGAKVLDEGPVSGLGWTGTQYKFGLSHPRGTGRLVDSIICTVDVDRQGHIRSLDQTTAFVASGKPGTAGKTIYKTDFTFSDFGVRFLVTPPPASQIDTETGVGVQF